MMEQIQQLLLILISSALVSNVVLSQFLGLCPFLGVSKKVETAAGMGTAVIFVITLSSGVAGAIYKFILTPLNIQYLQTIVFILVIAALVQFVEMFLKKYMKSLYEGARRLSAADYDQLRGARCCADQRAEGVRHLYRHGKWLCDGAWFHDFHCHSCGHP